MRVVNITVYLPDEIGERAKAAELPLSRLLRDAVTTELERRAAMSETLTESETHEVGLRDKAGRIYYGRITGAMLAHESDSHRDRGVFLADDGRVILVEGDKGSYRVVDDPVEELRDELTTDTYIHVIHSLGQLPIVDI